MSGTQGPEDPLPHDAMDRRTDEAASRSAGSAPLGKELGAWLLSELLPPLAEDATSLGASLSRWTARLETAPLSGPCSGESPLAEGPSEEPPVEEIEDLFQRSGYLLGLLAAAVGAEIGNQRFERRALGWLEALLHRRLDGPPFVHRPPFEWPELAPQPGYSYELPLATLATLLAAQRAGGPATCARRLAWRVEGECGELEIHLEAFEGRAARELLPDLARRLPAWIHGAALWLPAPGDAAPVVRLRLPLRCLRP